MVIMLKLRHSEHYDPATAALLGGTRFMRVDSRKQYITTRQRIRMDIQALQLVGIASSRVASHANHFFLPLRPPRSVACVVLAEVAP